MSKMDVMAAFEKLGYKPVSTAEIKAALPKDAPELTIPSYLYTSLDRLVNDGRLKRVGDRYQRCRSRR